MDNIKTGTLIKELRNGRGMTQRQLADLLHITDRAVSKWERGLCAPDLSLLEPLAELLGVSPLELIRGERAAPTEHVQALGEGARAVMDYSKGEIAHKVRVAKKTYAGVIASCLALALLALGWLLWRSGFLLILDQSTSPDGKQCITVYSKNFASFARNGFSTEDATSTVMRYADDRDKSVRITYGDCVYQGMWWSPDSKKYVISLRYDDRVYLALSWLEHSAQSNLSAYLSMGVDMTELGKYGYSVNDGLAEIDYQFLQWALDSESMLIYYSFEGGDQETHDGYFWYNCVQGTVSAVLELDS